MKEYSKREQDKIKELAKEYKDKGYEVFVEPSSSELPPFLRNYSFHPDLIVRSPKENLVIEVKSSESISSAKNLENLSLLISNQKNWDFMLVLTNPKQKEEYLDNRTIVTPDKITISLHKVEELVSDNLRRYDDVALLYLWSVIESILRLGLSLSNYELKRKSIKSLLRDSQVLGIISKKDYDLFFSILMQRNNVSHGFFGEKIIHTELEAGINATKRILNELNRKYLHEDEGNYIDYLKSLSKTELDTEIDSIIADIKHEVIDDDEINSIIADTNAYAWDCDDYHIENIEFTEIECIVTFYFHASGEQDKDRVYHGNSISGTAEAVIDADENITLQNITASLETFDEDQET